MHPEDVAPTGTQPASECVPRSPTWEDQVLSRAGPWSWHQDNGSSGHTGFPHCFIPVLSASAVLKPPSLCVSVFSHGFLLSVRKSSLYVFIQISFLEEHQLLD